jgi:TonB family protein
MRNTILFLIAFFVITSATSMAQENKTPDQKPGTVETETPKNEVDRMLEEAAKRGEPIIASCVTEECIKNSTDVAAGLEPGRILQMPVPRYPPIARAAHAEGEIQVHIIISEEGKVIAAAAISGHPLLQATSVAAARNSVFTPTLLHGKPVKVNGVIKYNFIAQ